MRNQRPIIDDELKKILDALPDKPPRSRLEPYRDFIEELRRRNRTFREIAEILAEKCDLRVTGSGVHDFLRTRLRRERTQAKDTTKSTRRPVPSLAAIAPSDAPGGDELRRRIGELKARNGASTPDANAFEYDPDQPLRLKKPGSK